MRKLRRDKLPIEQEVEISWFQRRYGSASIAQDQIAKALRQRQMVSPEALAKPPIAAPQSAVSGGSGAKSQEKNGIITWAKRPAFLARTAILLPVEEFAQAKCSSRQALQNLRWVVQAQRRQASTFHLAFASLLVCRQLKRRGNSGIRT